LVRYNFPEYEIELEIPDNVYFPKEDSFFILESVEIADSHRFLLEIGGGSGIISIVLSCKHPSIRCLITDISFSSAKTINKNSRINKVNNRIDIICMDKMQALRQTHPDLVIWNPPYLPSDEEIDSLTIEDKKMLIGGKRGYEEVYELLKYIKYNRIKTTFYTLFSSIAWNKKNIGKLKEDGFSVQIIRETSLFFEKLYLVKVIFSDSDA